MSKTIQPKQGLIDEIKLKWLDILSSTSDASLHMMVLANLIMINKDFKEEAYLGWEFLKTQKKEDFEDLKEKSISEYLDIQKKSDTTFELNYESKLKYFEYTISGSPFYDEIIKRFKNNFNFKQKDC